MLAAIAVTATLLVSTASAASFTESIDSTWADRWHHSSLEKYNGKFVAEAPPGSEDVALKVILPSCYFDHSCTTSELPALHLLIMPHIIQGILTLLLKP